MSDILFKTGRFNLSRPGEHFVNPCCFGEDVAEWLRIELVKLGYSVDEPGQEDWGWYLEAAKSPVKWFIGIGGNSDEDPATPDVGEWRLMLKGELPVFKRLFGGKAPDVEPLAQDLESVLGRSSDIGEIRRE